MCVRPVDGVVGRRSSDLRCDQPAGQRHGVHTDSDAGFLVAAETRARYQPLKIGQSITVDTTRFGESEYQALLARVRAIITPR